MRLPQAEGGRCNREAQGTGVESANDGVWKINYAGRSQLGIVADHLPWRIRWATCVQVFGDKCHGGRWESRLSIGEKNRVMRWDLCLGFWRASGRIKMDGNSVLYETKTLVSASLTPPRQRLQGYRHVSNCLMKLSLGYVFEEKALGDGLAVSVNGLGPRFQQCRLAHCFTEWMGRHTSQSLG